MPFNMMCQKKDSLGNSLIEKLFKMKVLNHTFNFYLIGLWQRGSKNSKIIKLTRTLVLPSAKWPFLCINVCLTIQELKF